MPMQPSPSLSQPPTAPGLGGGRTQPRTGIVVRSATSAKETILAWVQQTVNHYEVRVYLYRHQMEPHNLECLQNVNVTNFSTSWNDGLAFCALIHNFYPEAFDFAKLDAKNRRYNFTLAFKAAE